MNGQFLNINHEERRKKDMIKGIKKFLAGMLVAAVAVTAVPALLLQRALLHL